jgi:lipopolysaccharide transport system ATP-binding protein
MDVSIRAEKLGIQFLFDSQSRSMTPGLARIRRVRARAWGLRGVDLAAGPGEGIALIGSNGAGKTTLLRVLASVYVPDEGEVEVRGRVGSLLSISAGLTGRLTGRENCLLLGVLEGLSRPEARAAMDEIAERSGLAEAFDRPVSAYSLGMRARLGFAVTEQMRPQVLLLDEVHEAVDHEFRQLIEARTRAILDEGGVVVAAGHDHAALGELCSRAIVMQDGGIRADGPFEDTTEAYVASASDGAG